MSPVTQTAVVVFEYALVLLGLGYIGWLFFSPAGRAAKARSAALPVWDVSPADFLLLGWLVLSLGVLAQFLLQTAAGAFLESRPEGGTLERLLIGSMFHFAAVATWLGARAWARRHRPAAILPRAPVTIPGMQLILRCGLLAFIAVMPLAGGAGIVWEHFLQTVGLPTGRQELVDLFLQTRSPVSLGFLVALALVVAPVGEELVFRVGIFRYLRTRTPRWVAFAVSAGLFALLHCNWMSSLPLFILGLVFAVSYERTGRMAVPVVAHALFNLNSLLLVLSGADN